MRKRILILNGFKKIKYEKKYLWFANKVSARIDKQAKQRIFARKKNATNIKKA